MMALQDELNRAVEAGKLPAVGAIALDASGKELFKGAAGHTIVNDPNAPAFTTHTPMLVFSCTKLVTSVAGLQLLEQGKIKLDDLVEKYVPSIKDIQVLDGFEDGGKPILRAPKTKPTILNLFTHTTGLSYDFFDKDCLQWRIASGQNPSEYITVSALSNYQSPYRHDPGADYTYGTSCDYLGFVIEAVTGEKLQDYVAKHITDPLGLKNTGLVAQKGKDFLTVHMKDEQGKLTPNPDIVVSANAEVIAGGHYLTSTLEDYAQFLLAVVNHGTHPNGTKLLEAKTVDEYLFKDFIPQICSNKEVGVIGSSIPPVSNEGEFLPTVPKGWSCGLMLNNEDAPTGRARGTGFWAGLGNLYFFADPRSGKLAMLGSGMFPFFDTEAVRLFELLERTVYGKQDGASNHLVTKAIAV